MNEMLIRALPVRQIHLAVPVTKDGVTTKAYLHYVARQAHLTFASSKVLLANEGELCSYIYSSLPSVLELLKNSERFDENAIAYRLELLSSTGLDSVQVEAPLQEAIKRMGAIIALHSPFEGTSFQRYARPLGLSKSVSPWVLKGSIICPRLRKKLSISLLFMPGLKEGSWSFSVRCSLWHSEFMEKLSFWIANATNALREDGYEIVPFIFD